VPLSKADETECVLLLISLARRILRLAGRTTEAARRSTSDAVNAKSRQAASLIDLKISEGEKRKEKFQSGTTDI